VDTDVADAEAVERLMTQAADLGTLRVLVNNSGGWLPGPQYPEGREWRRGVDLNLIMPMLATECHHLLLRQGSGPTPMAIAPYRKRR
jgi:NAD(P)-dependent dehydrogenase (short-subunit alcohol dehydrogenase family)